MLQGLGSGCPALVSSPGQIRTNTALSLDQSKVWGSPTTTSTCCDALQQQWDHFCRYDMNLLCTAALRMPLLNFFNHQLITPADTEIPPDDLSLEFASSASHGILSLPHFTWGRMRLTVLQALEHMAAAWAAIYQAPSTLPIESSWGAQPMWDRTVTFYKHGRTNLLTDLDISLLLAEEGLR